MDYMASLGSTRKKIRVWIQKKAIKQTVKRKLTTRKTMVLIAFTSKPKRFSMSVLPPRQSVDATFIKSLQGTGKRLLSLKKNKVSLKELHLQMDNARPHTAAQTQQFLEGRTVTLFPRSEPTGSIYVPTHKTGPQRGGV